MPYFDTMFTLALRLRRVGLGLWYVGIILVESRIMSTNWCHASGTLLVGISVLTLGHSRQGRGMRSRSVDPGGFGVLGRPRSDGASVSALTNKAKALSEQNTDGSWKL